MDKTQDRKRTLVCPAGHTGDDLIFIAATDHMWWPACLRCLAEPMPDESRQRPESAA